MASQRFCLRWNNHQSNLLSVFDQLLHAETFTDVTLAVEGQLLKAHKMVLSACSPYFQALFVNHQEKHPIVILKDVPYSDMRSLLDFMYRGEVSVDQDRLTAFLRVAESLRIKGLTEVNDDKGEAPATLGPPPQLHRLNRGNGVAPSPNSAHQGVGLLQPLLGGSMQPKRKRGRPRKLSGGEEMEPPTVLRGEPERLEVSVGAESFGTDEPVSGDDEALLIDEGDDPQPPSPSPPQPMQHDHAGKTPPGLLTPKSEHPNEGKLQSALTADLLQGKIRINPLTQTATTSNLNALETSPNFQTDVLNNNSLPLSQQGSPRQPTRRRVRRRANSASNDPAEQLTEMSVRGLNLFRYASVNEGIYQCTECAKENIQKTFKNKYSFQRHAFLYHEGKQRKVFPCPVCCKEFSRPDKMKNHMKTTHECYMPKDCVYPPPYFLMGGGESPVPPGIRMDSPIGLKVESGGPESSPRSGGGLTAACTSPEPLPRAERVQAIQHFMNTTESRLLHEDDLPNATPVITLELLSRSDRDHNVSDRRENLNYTEGDTARPTLILDSSSGVHFLTEDQASSLFSPKLEPTHTDGEDTDDMALSPARSKQELLEYLIRSDGSVVCKLCGEILQSRTHWYRHKYKFHVAPTASPAPLYKCEQCSVFFKSRKGYIGHLASRHPEGEGSIGETSINMLDEPNIKQEPIDAELAIPRCELPNTNYTGAIVTATPNIVANTNCTVKLENKKVIRSTKGGSEGGSGDAGGVEWEKQRRREERLVADIIARVRRECEASGASGGARRGYSRRSALTNG